MDDDKLILYYYGELSEGDRQDVATGLRNDAGLAARYRELERELAGLGQDDVPAVPAHVTARWHDAIERAARMEQARARRANPGFNLLSFLWGAALAGSLAVGIAIGVYFAGDHGGAPAGPEAVAESAALPPAAVPAAFSRGLQVHLRDSRRNLSALPTRSAAERTLLIMEILEQNRLYQRAAEQKNSPQLARVLRAFEPILVRLAAEDLAPEDAEALRAQLAFELNVVLTKLARETSEEPETI